MLSVLGKALIFSMGNYSTIHRLAVIVNVQMQTSSRRTFSLFLDPPDMEILNIADVSAKATD